MIQPGESAFSQALRQRVAQAQQWLAEARADGDDYLMAVSVSEIESFARLATDNQITLDGVEESLATYRLA